MTALIPAAGPSVVQPDGGVELHGLVGSMGSERIGNSPGPGLPGFLDVSLDDRVRS